jgi:hypothetical protein
MIQKLAAINQAIGVSLMTEADGTLDISLCQLSRKGDQLTFDKKLTGLHAVNELSKHIPAKSVIALNLTGKGILYKQVERIDEVTPNNFGQVLPNANIEDFYIQHFSSGQYSFIAVIRKAEVDNLIKGFADEGFNVVMLSLGPFAINHILPQLNVYGDDVIFDGHAIYRNEQKEWIKYQYDASMTSAFPLKIETEKIDEQIVLAYAAAFQLMMADNLDPVIADVASANLAYQETQSLRKLKAYGIMIIAALFVSLLLNFMVFSYYESSNTQLAYHVSRSTQNTTQLKDITGQIKNKEQQLQYLGWDGGISKARLTDQLAAEMPPEITWKQVEINPVDINGSRNQKILLFKDGMIRVTGLSAKIIPVNEWMARIKTKHWVKDIQLENYNFNSELNTGQFILNITY